MDISKMLTISTRHISEKTYELLRTDARTWAVKDFVVTYAKKSILEYSGFWILVPDDYEECRKHGGYKDVPDDLHECLLLAIREGCEWLCLDNDGEVLEELKTY